MGYPFSYDEPDEKEEQKPQQEKKPENKKFERPNAYYTVEVKKAEIEPVLYYGNDLNDICYTIISCLNHVSAVKYFGKSVLADILRGANSQSISKWKLDTILEYGQLEVLSREEIIMIIEWLVDVDFILITKGQYPVLHPTYNGNHYNEVMTKSLLNKLLKVLNNED